MITCAKNSWSINMWSNCKIQRNCILPAIALAKSVFPHPVGPCNNKVSVSEDSSHCKPIIRYSNSISVSSKPATFRKFTVESLKAVSSFFLRLRKFFWGVGEVGRLLLTSFLTARKKNHVLNIRNEKFHEETLNYSES